MTDRTLTMTAAKRALNDEKHQRVRAVIVQILDHGQDDDLKAAVIARRADVHRSFVSNHFAGEIAHAKAELQSRFIAGLGGQTALTAASLRVELETAKHHARDAERENRALKDRLARALGDDVAAQHPEHGTGSSTAAGLRAEVEQLLAAQVELRVRLRDSEEELDAARRLNRTLMRERNTPAGAGG
jgi:hypothetical protein